jgi:hypothetical protein
VRKPTLLNPACEIAGCPNLARVRKGGLCSAHYERLRRTGDVMADRPVKQHRSACTAHGCERRHYANGYCTLHGDRLRRTGRVDAGTPSRILRKILVNESGHRFCYCCERWLTEEAFTQTNVCSRCRQTMNFGLSSVEWDDLFDSQGKRCAACGVDDPGMQGWHTDHDHRCCPTSRATCGRCLRGILCGSCNTAIGLLKDDPVRLRRAAAYLESYSGVGFDEAAQPEGTRPPEAVA